MPDFKVPVKLVFAFKKQVKVLQKDLVNQEPWELAAERSTLPRLKNKYVPDMQQKKLSFTDDLDYDADKKRWEGTLYAHVVLEGHSIEEADTAREAWEVVAEGIANGDAHYSFLPKTMHGWELSDEDCDYAICPLAEVLPAPGL